MLVGNLEQKLLDLGAELEVQLFRVDHGTEPVGGPGGQAVAIVAGGLGLGSLVQVAGHSDPDRKLSFLLTVVLAGQALHLRGDIRPGKASPTRRDQRAMPEPSSAAGPR